MKRVLTVLILLVLAWMALRESDFYLGGIQVNEPDHAAWMEALDDNGMNTVSVTVYLKQGDWDSDNLWWDESDDGVASEVRAARRAGIRVVLILRLALDHAFRRNQFLWHGMVMPATGEALDEWFRRYEQFAVQWARFAEAEGIDILAVGSELNSMTSTVPLDRIPALEEYFINEETQAVEKEKLLRHAERVEERHLWVRGGDNFESYEPYLDARTLAKGAWARQVTFHGEPEAVEHINRRRERLERGWREVIAAVRRAYGGRLTYAANFDQFHEVRFWDDLDLMGVNAYFKIRPHWQPLPDVDRLYPMFRQSWTTILDDLDNFRQGQGIPDHPVIFTELGYTRQRNSTLEPWAGTGFSVVATADGGEKMVIYEDEPLEPRERALAVRALYEASQARDDNLLQGLLWWKLSTEPAHTEVEPFVLVLGGDHPDPLIRELAAFTGWPPLARLRSWWVTRWDNR